MRVAPKPTTVDVDVAQLQHLVDKVAAHLTADESQLLRDAVATMSELMRLVRQRGTTIAQLRRLLGWSSSEKTSDVLPALTDDPSRETTTAPGTSATEGEASESEAGDATNDPSRETTTAPGTSATEGEASESEAGDASDRRPRRRRGHGRIPVSDYPNAQQHAVEHECLRVGQRCPACARGNLFQLREPARLVRIVGQPPLAAHVWNCERLRCSGCGKVFTASAPPEAQGGKYAESAVSMMALLRYRVGVPLHRLGRLQRHLETPVPPSTQWEVVRDHVPVLQPVHEELCVRAAAGRVLHNDDTSMPILEFLGKRLAQLLARGALEDPDRTGLFTTAVVSRTDEGDIALFFTGRKHAGENLTTLLNKRDSETPPPIHMCDGLDRNRAKSHDAIFCNCLSHGRRHIVDQADNFPAECRHVLEELGKVFQNDDICRDSGMTPEQRLLFHQTESAPIMAALESWLRAELDNKHMEPNSGLGNAYNYLLSRWQALTLFLRVPGAPLDNNICERALKMAIRHRNNSLFYKTLNGARVGDIYMSLIYTAELCGENPFDYLTALLEHEHEVADNPAAWLPWTYRATLARATNRAA
jgi:transposase